MEQTTNDQQVWHCRLDTSGRVVLPQSIRHDKGIKTGDELTLILENGAIILRTYQEAIQKLQHAFCDGLDPNPQSGSESTAEHSKETNDETGR